MDWIAALSIASLVALGLAVSVLLRCYKTLWRVEAGVERQQRAAPDTVSPRYFYLSAGGLPKGPVALTSLHAMLADGRLGADALVVPVGSDEWRPIALVVGKPGHSASA